jgi:hypothetical protein
MRPIFRVAIPKGWDLAPECPKFELRMPVDQRTENKFKQLQ